MDDDGTGWIGRGEEPAAQRRRFEEREYTRPLGAASLLNAICEHATLKPNLRA